MEGKTVCLFPIGFFFLCIRTVDMNSIKKQKTDHSKNKRKKGIYYLQIKKKNCRVRDGFRN